MYIDKLNTYTGDSADPTLHDQQLTVSGVSEHIIDHTINDIGPGESVCLVVQITEDSDATGLTVALETSANENFLVSEAIVTSYEITELTAGSQFALFALPAKLKQYSRVNFTLTGTPTAGRVWAGLVKDVQYGLPRPM